MWVGFNLAQDAIVVCCKRIFLVKLIPTTKRKNLQMCIKINVHFV
jgi:hypothetical protein